jgi:hypothetical protein
MLETSVQEATVANTQSQLKKPKKVLAPLQYTSVHRTQVRKVVEKLDGRFVGVDFVKQDGSVRRLNGRLGVRSYLKGGVNTVESDARPYLTVFDVKTMGYRTVNLETMCSLRADRHVYSIIG